MQRHFVSVWAEPADRELVRSRLEHFGAQVHVDQCGNVQAEFKASQDKIKAFNSIRCLSRAIGRNWNMAFAPADDNPDRCWPWTGPTDDEGYGVWKEYPAHVVAFVVATDVQPNDREVVQECGDRRCCNPAHLVLQTVDEYSGASKSSTDSISTKTRQ